MTEEKIETLHPKGKNGVRISKSKYEIIRKGILEILTEETLPFMKMAHTLEQEIGNSFDGSVSWYAVTVKLDLEARGIVQIVPHTKPPLLTVRKTE